MIIDYGNRTVGLKIVFFGPAMSGKTTAIRWLFSTLDYADKLTSIENTVGRTMFCDFGTIPFPLSESWTINAHVWSATGQDFYKSTREVVLVGADGVIFMADSQGCLIDENLASWNELMTMIAEEERPLPVVFCLNKQDLPSAIQEEQLRIHLRLPSSVPVFRSVAKDGHNILEAFQYLFQAAMRASVIVKPIS
ncbi:MAG: GTPase domain-containing protein [Candidatus Thorarchaeota archaeon]|nr:GTPase domain-containing protein [Candidatus Thorarchaeota archaeon]